MVRHTNPDEDEPYAEAYAAEYAADPCPGTFDAAVEAVRMEYDRDGHDPTGNNGNTATDTATVLTPVGLAVRVCADALADDPDTVVDDAASMIDFDGSDEVTVDVDTFDTDDPHATPMSVVRLATYADDATDRTVRFRDGAGSVRVYVEVPERRDDE